MKRGWCRRTRRTLYKVSLEDSQGDLLCLKLQLVHLEGVEKGSGCVALWAEDAVVEGEERGRGTAAAS